MTLSVSRQPSFLILSASRRFMDLTPTSALPLPSELYRADRRWMTSQRLRNASVSSAVNSWPPSLVAYSGTPNVANRNLSVLHSPPAPVASCEYLALAKWGQPLNLFTVIKYLIPRRVK